MGIEDNGGPAFPGMEEVGNSGDYTIAYNPGMTLRDYFAAKALQGMLAAPFSKIPAQTNLGITVKDAYVAADAMLEARKK